MNCAWWPQNPQTAKVREEINRLAKRVKKSEKELEGKRKESVEQEARIRKLQEDEQNIAAGAICQSQVSTGSVGHVSSTSAFMPCSGCMCACMPLCPVRTSMEITLRTQMSDALAPACAAQKEAETQARGAPGELRLDQATQAEFFKISEVAGSRTAKARADRESLLRQQRMDEDICTTNADALASLDTRLAQLRSQASAVLYLLHLYA